MATVRPRSSQTDNPSIPETPATPILEASKPQVSKAKAIDLVEAADGKVYGVKRPNALERVRLFEILGPESSQNQAVIMEVLPAYMVLSIDGDEVRRPTSRRELDARLMQLGDDGLEAIRLWMIENYQPTEAEKEIIKKLSGTPDSDT